MRSLIACLALVTGLACYGVTLVQDHQPQSSIVLPAQPTPTEQFAASELARYVEAMSGARLPVLNEPAAPQGVPIYVGATQRLAKTPEALRIQVKDADLSLLGGSDRGTLYAVYRFLETLGCRWLAPGLDYVPKQATLTVEPMDLETAPAFDLRLFGGRPASLRDWGCKMGMNGFYTAADRDLAGNGYYDPQAVSGCHAYHQIMPSDKYFADHPEWFPLIRGQRQPTKGHNSQLCVTAPGLADEFAANVSRLFEEDPHLQVVSISPNDGYGWCECEQCLALDQKLCGGRMTKQGLSGDKPFMGDRVFWFANQVAERVGKVHPDKLLLVLAYVNYAEPPDTVKPLPNVIPWLCHYAPADYSRPINDPTSEPNAQFNDLLKRWAKLDPDLLMYSYVSKSMWWRLPRPVLHGFAADLKYLKSLGLHRYYCQSGLNDWALDGPLYYVIAKLLWDPQGDPDAIAADWTKHMFGPAATSMARYYDLVEQSRRLQSFSDDPIRQVPGLYDPQKLDEAQQALDAAATAAAGDEAIAARVKQVTDVFRYGCHMIKALEAMAAFERGEGAERRVAAAGEIEQALTFCKVSEAQQYLESIRLNVELGVLATGIGKAEELGGRRCWNTDETGLGDNAAGWATLMVDVPDPTKPARLQMDVWGKSALASIVVNTDGQNRSFAAGGIWTPITPEKPLSGLEQWDTLTFIIPPKAMAAGKKMQRLGLGGADSQIWISNVRVKAD